MKFNQTEILESVVAHQLKSEDDLPNLSVGDTIDVHQRIIEGGKERTQVFQGVLIGMKGRGINRMITVRRIVANEGVERIFPLHSPKVAKKPMIALMTRSTTLFLLVRKTSAPPPSLSKIARWGFLRALMDLVPTSV